MLDYEDDTDFDDLFDDAIEIDEGTCDVELLDDNDRLLIDDICPVEDLQDKDPVDLHSIARCRLTATKATVGLTDFKLNFFFEDNEPADLHDRFMIRTVELNLHKRDRIHQVRPLSAKRLL